MSEALILTPHRLLRTNEAAQWPGLSGRTLEKHRCVGTGPTYRKIGGRVVYAMSDLQDWADRGSRLATSERLETAVSSARRPSRPFRGTWTRQAPDFSLWMEAIFRVQSRAVSARKSANQVETGRSLADQSARSTN